MRDDALFEPRGDSVALLTLARMAKDAPNSTGASAAGDPSQFRSEKR